MLSIDSKRGENSGERRSKSRPVDDITMTFNVRLDPAATETVTVDYATADGTATAGDDYTATSGTLTFGPGETTQTIEVPIHDDLVEDNGETFTLTLSNASGAQLDDAEATGTIKNTEAGAGEDLGELVPEDGETTLSKSDCAEALARQGSGPHFRIPAAAQIFRARREVDALDAVLRSRHADVSSVHVEA